MISNNSQNQFVLLLLYIYQIRIRDFVNLNFISNRKCSKTTILYPSSFYFWIFFWYVPYC
jgi:hypothetical protein